MSQKLIITGGRALEGTAAAQGAKNSVLPLLAATLVCHDVCVLENCPNLRDVAVTVKILEHLGCQVRREGSAITVDARAVDRWDIPDDLMHEMRSSVIFLGAILTRTGQAELSYPGGCELGARPIDLHLSALRTLGMEVTEGGGRIECRHAVPRGCVVRLPFPSVGATENAMLAALSCPDTVTIENAAREPEIVDLQDFLCAMGASVSGAGSASVVIRGRQPLHGAHYQVMPDRIVTATWLAAACATGGQVRVQGARANDLEAVLEVFRQAGCRVDADAQGITLDASGPLHAVPRICTAPYPAFPTDAQAPMMAALLLARGVTEFEENIFESRFRHIPALRALGADIQTDGKLARVTGVRELHGAQMAATDLRGGAAMLIAALSAQGESQLTALAHLDRGYEDPEGTLNFLGGCVKRVDIP